VDWFAHIAAASEELRLEFDYMVNVGGTPRNYGLKVKSHPVLLVTSAVKMRNGTTMRLTYSGDISETIMFDTKPESIKENWDAVSSFLTQLPAAKERTSKNGYTWSGISSESILNFLEKYKSHPDARRADTRLLASYIRRQVEQDELIEWSVLLASSSETGGTKYPMPNIGELGLLYRAQYPETATKGKYSIRRLLSPADEAFGLSEEEYKEALAVTEKSWELDTRKNKSKNPPKTPSGKGIREARPKTKALMILYPLDGMREGLTESLPVMGMAISFPSSDTAGEISYTANNVYTNAGDIDNI
jgi:hypothetical protein